MIDYDEEWIIKLIFQRQGSVASRASLFAVPAAVFAVLLLVMDDYYPELRRDSGMLEISGGQVWAAATACLMLMLGFRAKQAFDRFWEGTGLLHQMRGEWFDAVSCCITFTMATKDSKPTEVMAFRHTIVRLMSLCHGSALEEIKADETDVIETIDVAGLDVKTLAWIVECKEDYDFNRVELILHMTQTLITKALEDGTLKIAPPILSRVYQTLSRGFVNLLNAKKITDTRFPFPFAQLITMLLFLQVLATPLVMSVIFESKVLSAASTFCFVFGAFSINFISSELENPFGNDDNDLPLAHFQAEMNNSLLMLLHPKSDHLAGINEDAKMEFSQLFVSKSTAWDESQVNSEEPKPQKDWWPAGSQALGRPTGRGSLVSLQSLPSVFTGSQTPSRPTPSRQTPSRGSLQSLPGRRNSEASVIKSQSLSGIVGAANGSGGGLRNSMSGSGSGLRNSMIGSASGLRSSMEYDILGSGGIGDNMRRANTKESDLDNAVEPIASSMPSSRTAFEAAGGPGSPMARAGVGCSAPSAAPAPAPALASAAAVAAANQPQHQPTIPKLRTSAGETAPAKVDVLEPVTEEPGRVMRLSSLEDSSRL